MALELNKLTQDVAALSVNLAERLTDLAERLPAAQANLRGIGEADDVLRRKVDTALGFRWAGAIPTGEPVDAAFPPPAVPARHTVIAADGSQIYPDRDGVAV